MYEKRNVSPPNNRVAEQVYAVIIAREELTLKKSKKVNILPLLSDSSDRKRTSDSLKFLYRVSRLFLFFFLHDIW